MNKFKFLILVLAGLKMTSLESGDGSGCPEVTPPVLNLPPLVLPPGYHRLDRKAFHGRLDALLDDRGFGKEPGPSVSVTSKPEQTLLKKICCCCTRRRKKQ